MADPHSQHSSVMTIVCSLPNHPIWRAVLRELQGTPPQRGLGLSYRAGVFVSWGHQDLLG